MITAISVLAKIQIMFPELGNTLILRHVHVLFCTISRICDLSFISDEVKEGKKKLLRQSTVPGKYIRIKRLYEVPWRRLTTLPFSIFCFILIRKKKKLCLQKPGVWQLSRPLFLLSDCRPATNTSWRHFESWTYFYCAICKAGTPSQSSVSRLEVGGLGSFMVHLFISRKPSRLTISLSFNHA